MIRLRSVLVPAALVLGAHSALAGGGELSESDRQAVRDLFVKVMSSNSCTPTPEHECGKSCEEGWKASKKLTSTLVKMPASWEAVEPLFLERYKANETGRGEMLGFLAKVGSEGCVASAEMLYAKTPESFSDQLVVAFAERSSKTFCKAASTRVRKSKYKSVLPAAYLAIRGDCAGKATLEKAVQVERLDETNVFDALVAAEALGRLGDKKATLYTRQRLHKAVLAALDEGDLDLARGLAIRAEVIHDAFAKDAYASKGKAGGKSKKTVSLSYLDSQMGWHVKKRSQEVATADDVFRLIERLTSIS